MNDKIRKTTVPAAADTAADTASADTTSADKEQANEKQELITGFLRSVPYQSAKVTITKKLFEALKKAGVDGLKELATLTLNDGREEVAVAVKPLREQVAAQLEKDGKVVPPEPVEGAALGSGPDDKPKSRAN